MKNDKLKTILEDIGLTDEEAETYLAALSLGPTTVLRMARETNIKRTTIYSIVDSLKEKGLMRIDVKGLKQLYVAESPEKLDLMLERKKNEFSASLPAFMSLYTQKEGESSFKYYHGLVAIKRLYVETLNEIKRNEEYLVIANQEKWFALDPEYWMKHYIEPRAKLHIQNKLLFQDSPVAREHKKFEKNFNQEVRILPQGTLLNVDMLVLPKKLIVIDLAPPLTALVIENQSIVELQRNLFTLVWNSLKK